VDPLVQVECPGAGQIVGNAALQLIANWLAVCLCTQTNPPQSENIGGVSLDDLVDLSGFDQATRDLFGGGNTAAVGTVLAVANQNLESCSEPNLALIQPVLAAMAQDPGTTIIIDTTS
jgi:hypothetical protein